MRDGSSSQRLGHDVPGDRRRRLAAAAAVLDHHGDRVARLAVRGERHEQGVIALFPGLVLVLAHAALALGAADPAHLWVPVLPAMAIPGLGSRASRAVPRSPLITRCMPSRTSAAPTRRRRAAVPEPHRPCRPAAVPAMVDRLAAIGDPRGHDRELQRRRLHEALADANHERSRPSARARRAASFQARSGTRPARSPGRSMFNR